MLFLLFGLHPLQKPPHFKHILGRNYIAKTIIPSSYISALNP